MTRDTSAILQGLQKQMEYELRDFYRAPVDGKIRADLDAFLRKWEGNFAPYVTIKFTYRIDGPNLDITATIPEPPKFIVDIRRRGLSVLDKGFDL